ncbi:MAG: hypothetical protein LUE29_11580 [Lachnospiraceae bacterium]|nr:hypothetical protein [Lachnospiraceae bacterium]
MENQSFCIDIAGKRIVIRGATASAKEYCRGYITDLCGEKPDEEITLTPELLAFEREQSRLTHLKESGKEWNSPEWEIEVLAVYRRIAERMPFYDTVLFHGSSIAVDDVAYLFTAKSGTGKSTHVRLWREYFGNRAVMVNDDKPLIRIMPDGSARVCGTPWMGKHRLGNPLQMPLKAICILERGEENRIVRIGKREAYSVFLQQIYHPYDPAAMAKTVEVMEKMMNRVGLYRLSCNMEPEAARVAYEGMNL